MRPAVYASVVRNRKHSSRRAVGLKHEFSKRQMILMLFIGSLLVTFGLIVTIVGLVKSDDITAVHGDRVFYKVIGPAGLACGIGLVAAGGIYYCCWGYRPGGRLRHTSTGSVPTVSQPTNQPTYSSVKSQSSPQHRGSNSFCQQSSQCNSPPPYQVTTSSHRPRITSRSSQNSNDVGSSYLPHQHRCSSSSSSQQISSYKNRNDSKSDESLPDDALGGSSDAKLEMTEGVLGQQRNI
ncbi:hypothetical protein CHS0354_014243 [Potamilus streckersoni]|uniref:Uncharacterized protein n=1 Tax=Potamilus streckersoni TaxID=2493646 RepID=A0AAE0SAQ9_9BIVA|nr:hypothetical protein CHS0354_014243 [Potamilus streckersoni]